VVLTRPGDARSDAAMRLAYNAPDSQSGWAASEGRAFASYVCTCAHFVSVQAVADGRADIAFVDAVTWRILRAVDPSLAARVTVTEQTRPTPGLPLIAAAGVDPLPLRAALMAALDVIPTQVRQDLGGPVGLSVLNPAAYLALPIPAPPPT
jgi:ABC-type phosphate/phosphonate transport system substrate-binding protein